MTRVAVLVRATCALRTSKFLGSKMQPLILHCIFNQVAFCLHFLGQVAFFAFFGQVAFFFAFLAKLHCLHFFAFLVFLAKSHFLHFWGWVSACEPTHGTGHVPAGLQDGWRAGLAGEPSVRKGCVSFSCFPSHSCLFFADLVVCCPLKSPNGGLQCLDAAPLQWTTGWACPAHERVGAPMLCGFVRRPCPQSCAAFFALSPMATDGRLQ